MKKIEVVWLVAVLWLIVIPYTLITGKFPEWYTDMVVRFYVRSHICR